MKNINEILFKINDYYTKDDYMQIMLNHQRNQTFIGKHKGEQRIMYSDIVEFETQTNLYLYDERRMGFPYSNIPTHIEKIPFLGRFVSVNQIIRCEEPYINIVDGRIFKHTGFRDGNDYYIHTKQINKEPSKELSVSRKKIEQYLTTGYIDGVDTNDYKKVVITDLSSWFYRPTLEKEENLIYKQKERIMNKIDDYEISEDDKSILQEAIDRLEDVVEPINFDSRIMIKFGNDESIKLEEFMIIYMGNSEYKLYIANIPVTKESLTMIKANAMLPKVKMHREPKISLRLNPNITREYLAQVERQKLGKRLEKKY